MNFLENQICRGKSDTCCKLIGGLYNKTLSIVIDYLAMKNFRVSQYASLRITRDL